MRPNCPFIARRARLHGVHTISLASDGQKRVSAAFPALASFLGPYSPSCVFSPFNRILLRLKSYKRGDLWRPVLLNTQKRGCPVSFGPLCLLISPPLRTRAPLRSLGTRISSSSAFIPPQFHGRYGISLSSSPRPLDRYATSFPLLRPYSPVVPLPRSRTWSSI